MVVSSCGDAGPADTGDSETAAQTSGPGGTAETGVTSDSDTGCEGGDGGFGPAEPLPSLSGVGVGLLDPDLDGDGLPELVVLFRDGTLGAHRNEGSRTFGRPEILADLAPAAEGVALDWDRDGREELALVSRGGEVTLFRSDSTASRLRLSVVDTVATESLDGEGINAADVDDDAELELVVHDSDSIFTWDSPDVDGVLGPRTEYPGGSGMGMRRGVVVDVTGDGAPDLVVAAFSPDWLLHVFRGDGMGGFGAATSYIAEDMVGVEADVADMDGDGVVDVVVAASTKIELALAGGPARVAVLRGLGGGDFEMTTIHEVVEAFSANSLVPLDRSSAAAIAVGLSASDDFEVGGVQLLVGADPVQDVVVDSGPFRGPHLRYRDLDDDGVGDLQVVAGGSLVAYWGCD